MGNDHKAHKETINKYFIFDWVTAQQRDRNTGDPHVPGWEMSLNSVWFPCWDLRKAGNYKGNIHDDDTELCCTPKWERLRFIAVPGRSERFDWSYEDVIFVIDDCVSAGRRAIRSQPKPSHRLRIRALHFLFWPLGRIQMSHSITSSGGFLFPSLLQQARVQQRRAEGGPTHLRERGRAERRHAWSDPGRQTEGSSGGRAGDGLRPEDVLLSSAPHPRSDAHFPLCICVLSLRAPSLAMTKLRRATRHPGCRSWREIPEPSVSTTPSQRVSPCPPLDTTLF